MSLNFFSWLKSFAKTDDSSASVPNFTRKPHLKPQESSQDTVDKQQHYSSQAPSKNQFDVKEFLTVLESKLRQQDSSLEKDNCLQALSVARSISQFQGEANKVSMIKGLISYKEAMVTVRAVRWRDGLFCPKCNRTNIKIVSLENDTYEYKCVDCEKESGASGDDADGNKMFTFNDLTGLDIEKDMASVIKWVLCIYFKVFLSAGKISKYLGVDPEYALHLIHMINVDSKINKKKKTDYKDK